MHQKTTGQARASRQFDALHGLRGVAALCVLAGHFRTFAGIDLAPGNHLAVDLFFVLSGFVIAHAYDARLAGGMTFLAFVRARVRRLYPLYLLAALLGIAEVLASPGFSRAALAGSAASALLFLPAIPRLSVLPKLFFPLNGPAWSLFWELAVNALFGLIAVRLGKRPLMAIIGCGAVAVALVAWHYGDLAGGAYWTETPAGAARVVFSFFLGVYLRRHRLAAPTVPAILFAPIVLLVVAIMIAAPGVHARWIFDLAVVLLVWPAVILLASRIELRGATRRASHLAGEASYAIYVLHMPLIGLIGGRVTAALGVPWNKLPVAAVPAIAALIVALALAAHYAYDAPVRAWLSRRKSVAEARDDVVQF